MSSTASVVAPPRVAGGLTPGHRALCLMLRSQGGWWSVPDIVAHWRPVFSHPEALRLVQDLAAWRYVAERDHRTQQPSYGITSDCIALPQLDYSTFLTQWSQP